MRNANGEQVDDEEVFRYLEMLRQSGVTNMFGGAPWVKKEFHVTDKQAREVLGKWMKTYVT